MNLKKLAVFSILAGGALLISACNRLPGYGGQQSSNIQQQQNQQTPVISAENRITITFTDSGVSPSESKVLSGGKITWVNNSSAKVSVGSAKHPTHTDNPELTGGQFITELAPGASATVTVTKKGEWGFHNHLNPSVFGKVVVE